MLATNGRRLSTIFTAGVICFAKATRPSRQPCFVTGVTELLSFPTILCGHPAQINIECRCVGVSHGLCSTAAPQSSKKIQKLLVANRGEIACRVIATARRLGIPSVAVFSAVDRGARHVSMADEAVCIGEAPASESYLNAPTILKVAKALGATAIHPGYGFLSEDFKFAKLCQEGGITFVGPPAEVIRIMGDKSEAKQIMRKAKVPVVPGYDGEDQDLEHLIHQSSDIVGFPLLVKATVGGGGKGMKLANSRDELKDAISSAQREALASFGDSRVILEKFIRVPRHIEVQVMADAHGNVLHLFERDCSIQRRHQKIIEESPAPNISDSFRKAICMSAVDAARAVGYTNAGTVEFILDTESDAYYFMEMNTRLQVEHPVTEGICNLDLVELQFMVASGEMLTIKQEDVRQTGHCMEARLYAEHPHHNFLPGAGTVERWRLPLGTAEFCMPSGEHYTRIDSGVVEGDEVGVFYDPMIAKIIAKGQTREGTIDELHHAMDQLQVCGLPTNLELLKKVVAHPSFKRAELNTNFITTHQQELFEHERIKIDLLALVATVRSKALQKKAGEHTGANLFGPWNNSTEFHRLNHEYVHHLTLLTAEKDSCNVTMQYGENGNIQVSCEDASVNVHHLSIQDADTFEAQVDDTMYDGHYSLFKRSQDVGLSIWCSTGNCSLYTPPDEFFLVKQQDEESSSIIAPMHGRVVKVLFSEGDRVSQGDVLLILEAMKMEHAIKASMNGIVQSVLVSPEVRVHDGQTLINIQQIQMPESVEEE